MSYNLQFYFLVFFILLYIKKIKFTWSQKEVQLQKDTIFCLYATYCEELANEYQIDFNPTKSTCKLICSNANIDHPSHIILNGQPVSVVFKVKHLGNYILSSINDRHIIENTCNLYQRSNLFISQFRSCNSETLDRLNMTYCMHMYGCELWNLNENDGNQFKVAWKKIKRRIWEIPPRTHNNLVCNITNNIDANINKRIIRFIYNSINHGNKTNILRIKLLFVTIYFLQIINIYQISMA